ncbi:STAS domain-containing protein [Nocardia otitidiscaviarum]|uniref:Anti-sigma factor antagonist n=1 Tax=Nocardia otitidiscaviarum TaxID=1823 RepID=A0A516NHN9_9NOCA|nr:STAS domain-containing protein [Nocardia otitidiscaviarum]QDP78428.1 STAS domain-containing protein [Nocardia otitidiscaviarum]
MARGQEPAARAVPGQPWRKDSTVTESGTSRTLSVAVHEHDGTLVVTANGEIDIASVPELQSVLEETLATGRVPVLDMSGVGFMGSVGLSALLVAAEAAKPARLRVAASPQVRRPIDVTGLDEVVALFDTLDEALAAGELDLSV